MSDLIKKGNWVLCPQTKDDVDDPRIVAQVVTVNGNLVQIQLTNGTATIPRSYCKVVYVQHVLLDDLHGD